MKKYLLWGALALSPCLAVGAKDNNLIESSEGTAASDLAALKLPAPADIKVAVLPFSDYASDQNHVRIASGANFLLFQRQGFQLLPLADSFAAAKADDELEPGLPLRKSDAVRLGKQLGADWVVYGEVKDLRSYKKETFFSRTKNMWAALRVAVANVNTGDLFFYGIRSRKVGGTGMQNGFQSKTEQLERVGVTSVSNDILEPLFKALPAHETKGKIPESGDLAGFVKQTWPKEK
ncbi:hypothetical protein IAD21_01002 [Abditibacteriota bacterium]|nr:hypothetical protein IAD21_01002 [Abditibacteriota bacterium]